MFVAHTGLVSGPLEFNSGAIGGQFMVNMSPVLSQFKFQKKGEIDFPRKAKGERRKPKEEIVRGARFVLTPVLYRLLSVCSPFTALCFFLRRTLFTKIAVSYKNCRFVYV